MSPRRSLAVMVVLAACRGPSSPAPAPGAELPLVPRPEHVVRLPGAFALDAATPIVVSDPRDDELRALGEQAREVVRDETGLDLHVAGRAVDAPRRAIVLRLAPGTDTSAEGYRLIVDSAEILVSAPTHAGLFYGIQTLRQLLPAAVGFGAEEGARAVPAVEIVDRPRFAYRGMHLDVGRHLFPVEFIKRYIDLLAMYKMNTFHWHLTEDQGWRIEIERYPRLTEVGAWRHETMLEKQFDPYVGDGTPYGGFYSKRDVREIVAHARSRYVTVIPEIELPGHSLAALAAYPELACTEGPFEVGTRWGVYEDVFCPKEETFRFLEDVLTEVIDLFPSRYVHIGGDEVPKTRWKESAIAQEVMRREGLADEDELQSWFIRRIERFLLARARRLIGWDEILEGGLAPEATVMSWRGMAGGIEAARAGHDVIMTPTSHVYFDYYQGDPAHEPLAIGGYTPLEKVYAFEPVPDELRSEDVLHVLGAQGNVWTEYIKTPDHVEYMALPRMIALAEVVWSPRAARDWSSFLTRLGPHFRRLDRWGVDYRIPDVGGLERDVLVLTDRTRVRLSTSVPGGVIRYTTDGTDPTAQSLRYDGPLTLEVDERGTVVTARVFLPSGRASSPRRARVSRGTLAKPLAVPSDRLAPGLRFAYFESKVSTVDSLVGQPVREGVARDLTLAGFERPEEFGLVFSGYLRVPADGVYGFILASDDGSRLQVAGRLVIDHDGPHALAEREGMAALGAGLHRIELRYFQAGGGKALRLTVRRDPDGPPLDLADLLLHRPDPAPARR